MIVSGFSLAYTCITRNIPDPEHHKQPPTLLRMHVIIGLSANWWLISVPLDRCHVSCPTLNMHFLRTPQTFMHVWRNNYIQRHIPNYLHHHYVLVYLFVTPKRRSIQIHYLPNINQRQSLLKIDKISFRFRYSQLAHFSSD